MDTVSTPSITVASISSASKLSLIVKIWLNPSVEPVWDLPSIVSLSPLTDTSISLSLYPGTLIFKVTPSLSV